MVRFEMTLQGPCTKTWATSPTSAASRLDPGRLCCCRGPSAFMLPDEHVHRKLYAVQLPATGVSCGSYGPCLCHSKHQVLNLKHQPCQAESIPAA